MSWWGRGVAKFWPTACCLSLRRLGARQALSHPLRGCFLTRGARAADPCPHLPSREKALDKVHASGGASWKGGSWLKQCVCVGGGVGGGGRRGEEVVGSLAQWAQMPGTDDANDRMAQPAKGTSPSHPDTMRLYIHVYDVATRLPGSN